MSNNLQNLQKTYAGRSILRLKQRRYDVVDVMVLHICYMEDPDLTKGLPHLPLPTIDQKMTVDLKDINQYKKIFPYYSTILSSIEQYFSECTTTVHEQITSDITEKLDKESMEDLQKMKKLIKSLQSSGGVIDHEFWEFTLFVLHKKISETVLKDFISQRYNRYGRVLQKKFGIIGNMEEAITVLNDEILKKIEVVKFEKIDTRLDDPWLLEQISKMPLTGGETLIQDIDIEVENENKPKYFSRVLCGIEWTSYNQSNFTADNLPPQQILGYKFAIFYPNLVGIPEYVKVPDPDHKDKEIILFKSDKPYSTVRFRILKREWETNYKRGFNCVYENNTLHLDFKFKQYIYRP